MNEQSSSYDSILIGILTLIVILVGFSASFAQVPTPRPVDDKQAVQPEAVKGVPDIAKSYRSQDTSLPDIGRVGVDMLRQKPMALKEAIVKGLENNIDIEVTRQDVKIAEFDLKAADGSYEPQFTGESFFNSSTTPNISIFSRATETTNNSVGNNARFTGFIRGSGASYFAELSNQRVTTDNPISILSPQSNTSLTFGFVQPLFRGRSFDERRRVVEIAKKNLSLTDAEFRQKAIEITSNIQRAYWDLTFSLKNLQVQRDGVRDAKDQLEHNRRLVKQGVLAPVDIIAAETQVANLELQVYKALENVNRSENRLKGLISGDRNEAIWSEAILPTDSVDLEAPRTRLNDAIALALANRPEMESLKIASDVNKINQKYFREQDKPQIDLTATYSTSGVSGSFNEGLETPFQPSSCDPDPTSPQCQADIIALNNSIRQNATAFTGGFGSNVSDLVLNRYPTFRVGVTINLPLFGNKTAKANFGKSLVEGTKIETQRRQLEYA